MSEPSDLLLLPSPLYQHNPSGATTSYASSFEHEGTHLSDYDLTSHPLRGERRPYSEDRELEVFLDERYNGEFFRNVQGREIGSHSGRTSDVCPRTEKVSNSDERKYRTHSETIIEPTTPRGVTKSENILKKKLRSSLGKFYTRNWMLADKVLSSSVNSVSSEHKQGKNKGPRRHSDSNAVSSPSSTIRSIFSKAVKARGTSDVFSSGKKGDPVVRNTGKNDSFFDGTVNGDEFVGSYARDKDRTPNNFSSRRQQKEKHRNGVNGRRTFPLDTTGQVSDFSAQNYATTTPNHAIANGTYNPKTGAKADSVCSTDELQKMTGHETYSQTLYNYHAQKRRDKKVQKTNEPKGTWNLLKNEGNYPLHRSLGSSSISPVSLERPISSTTQRTKFADESNLPAYEVLQTSDRDTGFRPPPKLTPVSGKLINSENSILRPTAYKAFTIKKTASDTSGNRTPDDSFVKDTETKSFSPRIYDSDCISSFTHPQQSDASSECNAFVADSTGVSWHVRDVRHRNNLSNRQSRDLDVAKDLHCEERQGQNAGISFEATYTERSEDVAFNNGAAIKQLYEGDMVGWREATVPNAGVQSREDSSMVRFEECQWTLQQKSGEITFLKTRLKQCLADISDQSVAIAAERSRARQLHRQWQRCEHEIVELANKLSRRDHEVVELEKKLKLLAGATPSPITSSLSPISQGESYALTVSPPLSARTDGAGDGSVEKMPCAKIRAINGLDNTGDHSELVQSHLLLQAKVETLRRKLFASETKEKVQKDEFESERAAWQEEKGKVLRYQKKLEASCVANHERLIELNKRVAFLAEELEASRAVTPEPEVPVQREMRFPTDI